MNTFYEQKVTSNIFNLDSFYFLLLIIFIIITLFLIFVIRYYIQVITRIRNDSNISHTSILNKIDENMQNSISYQV